MYDEMEHGTHEILRGVYVDQSNKVQGPREWKAIAYINDLSNKVGAGVGLVFKAPDGARTMHSTRVLFPATNNQVEYEAIVSTMYRESTDLFATKEPKMKRYQKLVKVPRSDNVEADALAQLATGTKEVSEVYEEELVAL